MPAQTIQAGRKLALARAKPLLALFDPQSPQVIHVGPRNLQHGERRQPVEPDGPAEERPVPAEIDLAGRDSVTVDNVRMPLALSQYGARGRLRSEPVDHAVHDLDIESEHGEFRCAVSVREADRVGESRTDLVLGNHHDVTSVLLHILDDRQIRAVRFVSVTVVMAENTAPLERLISHVRRLRGERTSRAAGVRDQPFNRTASSVRERRLGADQESWLRSRGGPRPPREVAGEVTARMIRFAGFMAAGTPAAGHRSGLGLRPATGVPAVSGPRAPMRVVAGACLCPGPRVKGAREWCRGRPASPPGLGPGRRGRIAEGLRLRRRAGPPRRRVSSPPGSTARGTGCRNRGAGER